MRNVEKMKAEGLKAAHSNTKYDLHISEILALSGDNTGAGFDGGLYNIICNAYFFGMSAGMRYEKNKARRVAKSEAVSA